MKMENTTQPINSWMLYNSTGTEDTILENLSVTVTDKVLRILYIIIGTLGILGNALVVIVLMRMKNAKKKIAYLFIINQSAMDFLAAVFLLMTTVLPEDGRVYHSMADAFYCRVWVMRTPLWFFLYCSTNNLIVLTIERYLSVVHPIRHKTFVTYNKGIVAIVLVWLSGVIYFSVGPTLSAFISDGRCHMYVFSSVHGLRANGFMAFLFYMFIPVTVLIFCYSKMAYALRLKVTPPANSGTGSTTQPKAYSVHTRGKRNIIKTLIIVSVAFTFCVSWNQIFLFLFNCGVLGYSAFDTSYYHFSVVAMFANCCVNPFIYTAKYEEFKKELRGMLRARKQSQVPESSSHSNTTSAATAPQSGAECDVKTTA